MIGMGIGIGFDDAPPAAGGGPPAATNVVPTMNNDGVSAVSFTQNGGDHCALVINGLVVTDPYDGSTGATGYGQNAHITIVIRTYNADESAWTDSAPALKYTLIAPSTPIPQANNWIDHNDWTITVTVPGGFPDDAATALNLYQDDGGGPVLIIAGVTMGDHLITGLQPATLYTYTIGAENGDGVETPSASASDTTAPDAVTITAVPLSWSVNSDFSVQITTPDGDNYNLYFGSTNVGSAAGPTITVGSPNTAAGTAYAVTARKYDNTSIEGKPSNVVNVTTAPDAATDLACPSPAAGPSDFTFTQPTASTDMELLVNGTDTLGPIGGATSPQSFDLSSYTGTTISVQGQWFDNSLTVSGPYSTPISVNVP